MRAAGLRLLCLVMSVLACAVPARADHWFGSVAASCDSFGECFATFEMPDRPADSVAIFVVRSGKANAPVDIRFRVNKPVEGGVPARLDAGQTMELAAGTDVLTRREKNDGKEWLAGYFIAANKSAEVLAFMRRVDTARLTIPVAGQTQQLVVQLDGLDQALRFFDERQGRAGAQDALIDKGSRAPADATAPKPLPRMDAWPKEIARIFKREKCVDMLSAFGELAQGFVATPAPGRELWQIACAGGNYNILFILIDVRNGDMKTARALTLPTRLHKQPNSVAVNPWWWDARKELWTFERGRSAGDCGTVASYLWTARGFALANERRKDDCDGKFDNPWTAWPVVKSGRGLKR